MVPQTVCFAFTMGLSNVHIVMPQRCQKAYLQKLQDEMQGINTNNNKNTNKNKGMIAKVFKETKFLISETLYLLYN